MTSSPSPAALAIIGSGPSAIYLLRHLLDHLDALAEPVASIAIFEKSGTSGMGMPYSPETTDIHNLSNIASEELPRLVLPFADWLRLQDPAVLMEIGVRGPIDDGEVYPRLALGRYLQGQYRALVGELKDRGVQVTEYPGCRIADISVEPVDGGVTLVTEHGVRHTCGRLVIATGHCWPEEDQPERGRYTSPWPIRKLLPEDGTYLNFAIGTLGASLSAFDVVNSLAHRHGSFTGEDEGRLRYEPHPGTEGFRIVMHSVQGLLPHLQFAQTNAMREIYRHIRREDLLALVDARGFLRLERYFDKVCRPVLVDAFLADGLPEIASLLERPDFHLRDFVDRMTDEHQYADAFEGMRIEMGEALESVLGDRPIHWKETVDDLMYTLNFHAELMPAEDHLTLGKVVMPFLMNVIAAMPLPSGEALLALHEAGKLELVSGKVEIPDHQPHADSTRIEITADGGKEIRDYRMFIDCGGQKPLELEDYPFQSLVKGGHVCAARVPFSDPSAIDASVPGEKRDKLTTGPGGHPAFLIGGLQIDPAYRLIDAGGRPDPRLHEISFPLTSGLRPYSYGLQACNETARLLVEGWL